MRKSKMFLLAGLLSAYLAGCSSIPPITESPHPTSTLLATPTLLFAQSSTPQESFIPPEVSSTPIAEATPDLRWKVNAIHVQYSSNETFSWENDQLLSTIDDNRAKHLIDATTGLEISPIPSTPGSNQSIGQFFSPDQKYFIECGSGETRLYRSADKKLLTQAATIFCAREIVWAPNSQEVILTSKDGVYLWNGDGSPGKQIYPVEGYFLRWSPAGSRLLFVSEDPVSQVPVLIVADPNGVIKQLDDIDFAQFMGPAYWVNENVFAMFTTGAWASSTLYYDADTGRQLPSWDNAFGLSQFPSFSPDTLWRITDNSYRRWRGDPYASPDYFSHSYEVVNLYTGESYKLYESEDQYLDWVGWSSDSKVFYLLNRPAKANAIAHPDFPFGLMALNPATREVKMIFEQAVFARLSPDRAQAWVGFPVRRNDGSLGLEAGVFDMSTLTLNKRQPISDQISYGYEAGGQIIPNAWSNNSRWLVWGDNQGGINLIDTVSNTSTLIATDLPAKEWPNNVNYLWSPNDRYLFVQYSRQIWIANLSELS